MTHEASTGIPTVLFGAFDRHNFGDLLFPHIVAALLARKDLLFAGLAARDLRSHGGHRVSALAQLAAHWGERPVNIIHVGGELLSCDAWEAAVMLLAPDQAHETVARLGGRTQERLAWARSQLGSAALAPYTLPPEWFPHAARVFYNAVGGVDLNQCEPAMRAEVVAKLKAADDVSVRDQQTKALLDASGVTTRLIPDPAVMVAELFGTKIRQRARQGEVAQILRAFPQGYIAVQFSADFGDDQTLTEIAAQLDRIAISSGFGVAFFRAGAAPWHDDLLCYQRAAARMHAPAVKIFRSLNLWDICALIACSRVYVGSSLHGRIVAMAFALPRINLHHRAQATRPTKQTAFAATWEQAGIPATVEVDEIADGIRDALAIDSARLQHTASELVSRYRQGFNPICAGLKPD
ncbi:MAG: polysaccharide pyruvyl transferase family protein [Oxalobacteraceae bacterium]|nr:polysaccharide pyruvyl transferase family protein [Oxalobacteraceae bacterium]